MKKFRRKKVYRTKEKIGMPHVWIVGIWTLCLLVLLLTERNLFNKNTNFVDKKEQILTLQEIENLSKENETNNQKDEKSDTGTAFDASNYQDIRVLFETKNFCFFQLVYYNYL